MLEKQLHSVNAFVTLTYATNLTPAQGSLRPNDLQLFMKRLRKTIQPARIRFYAVGEYGEKNCLPHYHLALFGYPSCSCSAANNGKPTSLWSSCPICKTIYDAWGYGIIHVGNLDTASAQYICGYVLKKMTHRHDPRLNGREPEFARMSRRPGLGHDYMLAVAKTLRQYDGSDQADVPVSLSHGKKTLPLGRYLRKKLRKEMGLDEKAPQAVLMEQALEMQALYEDQVRHGPHYSIKNALVEQGAQTNLNIATRDAIFKSKKGL